MLELADDVAASWFLELWRLVPTPDKVKKVREGTVARLLKSHRIRRFRAAQALQRLRATPVTVAPGTVRAATAHLEAVAKRLQVVNRQIADADPSVCHPNLLRRSWALAHSAQLQRLTEKLAEADDVPGQDKDPCRESEGSSSPRCSQKHPKLCNGEITKPCAACPAWRP